MHYKLIGLLLISMDSLGMLEEIVEMSKLLSVMMGEDTCQCAFWVRESGPVH